MPVFKSRRVFATMLGLGAAIVLAGFAAPGVATAVTVKYSKSKFDEIRNSGKAIMLDFYAPWCGTCRTQSRAIETLRSENKAYEKIAFMKVDWDTNKSKPISTGLKIPRRSTLVMFRDGMEVGRIVAGTSKASIKKLMDKGLK